jgi:O-antigen ligase
MTALYDRAQLRKLADGLAAAVVAVLPWSTSATYIFLGVWLVVFLISVDPEEWSPVMQYRAATIPVLLVGFAAVGMLWAQAHWADRWGAFASFARLLVIPLLMVQFRRSDRAHWVFLAFAASCTVVLALSWIMVATGMKPLSRGASHGIPVRDYIAQAQEFVLCAAGFAYLAGLRLMQRRWALGFGLLALALLFVANVLFVTSSRTGLVTLPALLLVLVVMQCRLRYALIFAGVIVAVSAASLASSSLIQKRLFGIFTEIRDAQSKQIETSAGQRVEFWKAAVEIIADAPVIGHGTGSIKQTFAQEAARRDPRAVPTTNPHNQTLTVAVQLGMIGTALLLAMWLSHLLLFRCPGFAGWVGLAVVAQNVLSSLFNNHLFDFTQSWIYVFGVGVAGASVIRARHETAVPERPASPARSDRDRES